MYSFALYCLARLSADGKAFSEGAVRSVGKRILLNTFALLAMNSPCRSIYWKSLSDPCNIKILFSAFFAVWRLLKKSIIL
jgi:hypothetical protein